MKKLALAVFLIAAVALSYRPYATEATTVPAVDTKTYVTEWTLPYECPTVARCLQPGI